MKKIAFLISATAAILFLSACASNSAPADTATKTVAASGKMFCYKERLYTAGEALNCNWANAASEVCRGSIPASNIAVNAVEGAPVNASRCDNGQWLVQVTMK